MIKLINKIGVEDVRNLDIKVCRVPLVSAVIDERFGNHQKYMGNGYYLMGLSDTKAKIAQIEKIAKSLGLKIKVEKI